MNREQLERAFKRLSRAVFFYGDIELVRAYIFELDKVQQDLRRVDLELRFCNISVDKSREYWKNHRKM